MTVRLSHAGDTPRVLEMVADINRVSALATLIPFSAEMTRTEFLAHLGSRQSLCLSLELAGAVQGIFVGFVSAYPCSPVKLGIERVRWIDPAHRSGRGWLEMLRWFERWAKASGCAATSISSAGDARFENSLARAGYGFAEAHYIKAVG